MIRRAWWANGKAANRSLESYAAGQANDHIARPMREHADSGSRDHASRNPEQRCLTRIRPGHCRRHGPDVHRVSRGKGVARIAGCPDALAIGPDDGAIGPFPIHDVLDQMGKHNRRRQRKRQMIGTRALACMTAAGEQPGRRNDRSKNMRVSGPGCHSRAVLNEGAGVAGRSLRDGEICSHLRNPHLYNG
jgi:hypothetical protein